ncbi:MAG: polysaccharide pyruvyl transferase CsaB [Oscillospiraceae bacterium]|nr:polysaccharide pyruvyl transferase CsaB [Oscillospiraceae bacterium]
MKVVHLISGGDTGGAKTHVHSLLSRLRDEIDVTMVCFMEGPFAEEARALGIRVVVMPGRNVFKVYRKLKQFVLSEGFDLIHCHGARGNLMGTLLRRAAGVPVVTTVHSDYRLDYLGRPLSRVTYGVVNTMALRRMDYRIGVSEAMVDLLIDRGFKPGKLFSIYNGLDFSPRPVKLQREEYLRSVGLQADGDSVVVGIAARLDPVKDVGTLIRGFAKAYERCPKLRLLIAGDGQQMNELKALSSSLGLEEVCVFAGWISDVDSFYNAIDVNTLTSLSETFPYALTEGARAGLPTVSSRVGGVPYLIEHGVTGFLFPAGDADALANCLVRLADSASLRERLGAALYQKASTEYSLERTVSRQLEIYWAVLRRQNRPKGRDGVLVCGAYGRGNAGDDAILEAILIELRSIDPDLPLWVLSRNPKSTMHTYRTNAIYTFALPKFLWRMGRTKLYINGGGSLMQDVTSRRSLWFYLFTISAAKALGNKVLMYGCGIGPIRYAQNRRLAAGVLQKRVDAITLRDTHSKSVLEELGVTAPEITLSADPTVILPADQGAVIDAMMENQGLDPGGQYIGFGLRPWPGFSAHTAVLAAAADYAYKRHGLTPVFLPIERGKDVEAAKAVAGQVTVPCHVLTETGGSSHTIGLLARMQVVVSMRLHALVFAAGQGVPLVGVVYDPKVSSFLDYVGQDLYLDLNAVTLPGLTALIDAAVARREDKQFRMESVKRLREVECHNSEAAKKLLEQ